MVRQIQLVIAPIAWTSDDIPELGSENTFEQYVSEVALAGFKGTEVDNKYPKDPQVLRQYLDIHGLKVTNAWFSTFLTTKPFEETAGGFKRHRGFLRAMDAKVIVVTEQGRSIQGIMMVPVFDEKPIFSNKEWQKPAEGLEKLGDLAHEKGMKIAYHRHMGTGVQTTKEIDRLMKMTDPTKVKLLFDTSHLVFSGEDPIAIYQRYQDRIKHIHFKDIRQQMTGEVRIEEDSFLKAVKKGVFTVPGDGMIDFKSIWPTIEESGYRGRIIVEAEQDPAKANPFEYAAKARNYI